MLDRDSFYVRISLGELNRLIELYNSLSPLAERYERLERNFNNMQAEHMHFIDDIQDYRKRFSELDYFVKSHSDDFDGLKKLL